MSESATPESGALSVDEAVAVLSPEPVEQDAPLALDEAAQAPADEIEAEASPAEETPDDAEQLAEGEEEAPEEEPVVALDPPPYWKHEAKAVFATLTPEQQAVVLAQEGPREEITAKVKAEAATISKSAQERIQSVEALAEHLATFLPQAVQTFQTNWGAQEPDWEQVIEQYGAEEGAKLQARFNKEQRQLAQVAQATQAAQQEARKADLESEWKTLAEIAPDLAPDVADPKQGLDARQKVVSFLSEIGIPQAATDQISAVELALARDAMLWREAQAKLKAAPKPKPAAVAPKAPVRPAAAQTLSPTQRTAQQVHNRFAQTRSVDDAVALLLARKA